VLAGAASTCLWLAQSISGPIFPTAILFHCAYTLELKLAGKIDSLTHYTKGTLLAISLLAMRAIAFN
jgi:hypothetical protein